MLISKKLGLFCLLFILVASGCSLQREREKIYDVYSQVNKENLNEELLTIRKEYLQSGEDEYFLPKDQWPEELRQLKPKAVFVDSAGILIAMHRLFVEVAGLFYLPDNSSFVPNPSGDPSYTLIEGKIYYYYFGG